MQSVVSGVPPPPLRSGSQSEDQRALPQARAHVVTGPGLQGAAGVHAQILGVGVGATALASHPLLPGAPEPSPRSHVGIELPPRGAVLRGAVSLPKSC